MSSSSSATATTGKKGKPSGSTSYNNSAFDVEPAATGQQSGGPSPMGSNIFIVKPDGDQHNRVHPEPYRHEPVTHSNIGRTILRGIRCESTDDVRTNLLFASLAALWATRQTEKDLRKNKDLYVKTTIRELILYLVFITILCISSFDSTRLLSNVFSLSVTFGMTSTKTYYFTTVLRTIFTQQKVEGPGDQPAFDDIATADDFWNVRSLVFLSPSFLLWTFFVFR